MTNKNTTDRTIIIGDVHGCYREMMELLKKINPTNIDQVYFTGDLINKGKDSVSVVKHIIANGYHSVMGNHEFSYLNRLYHKSSVSSLPIKQGKKYQILDQLIEQFSNKENEWIADLPYYYDHQDFIIVHAGVFPKKSLVDHEPYQILNVRSIAEKPWHEYYTDDKLIVYGHWARQGLSIKLNSIGLDSGCVYGKALTALILPEKKIIQVPSSTNILNY